MNQVDVSREKVLQGFGAIAADNDIDINQFLDEQEKITVEQAEPDIDVEMPSTTEILQHFGRDIADDFAPALALQDDEIERLAKAYGPLIDKYFPGGWLAFLDRFKLEISAVATTYVIFAPRYRAYKKHLAAIEGKAEPAKENSSKDPDDGE